MTHFRKGRVAILLGAGVGALVLGLGGRAAMVGLALITGREVNLSPRGLLEVLLLGTIVGGVGGLLLLSVSRVPRLGRVGRGMLLGTVLFLASGLLSWFRRGMEFDLGELPFTLAAVAVVFLIYGVTLDGLFTRFEGSAKSNG